MTHIVWVKSDLLKFDGHKWNGKRSNNNAMQNKKLSTKIDSIPGKSKVVNCTYCTVDIQSVEYTVQSAQLR